MIFLRTDGKKFGASKRGTAKIALACAVSALSLFLALAIALENCQVFALSSDDGTPDKSTPDKSRSDKSTLGIIVYRKALDIFRKADVVHYEHKGGDESVEQVSFDGDHCQAQCDCSGYVSYVIKEVAPKHYEAIKDSSLRSGHPLASTYARFFAGLNPNEPQGGWLGIPSYKELRQGDLIAWQKAVNPDAIVSAKKKGNTGHVMIVESPARQVETVGEKGEAIRFVSIPVIDSSSVDHFPPEELPPKAHQQHRDGVGRGVVRLILDENEHVIGYWEGTYWGEGGKNITKPSYTSKVFFARMLHIPRVHAAAES